MDKCLKIKHKKFLWWKWDSKSYEHNWEYISSVEKECSVCGRIEMLFGYKHYDGHIFEDWRPKKIIK